MPLSKLSGKAFDKAYRAYMVRDHKKTIASFEKEAKSSTDNDLKSFANATLPTLQQHHQMAETANAASNR